jgi:hypothetical protein
VLLENVNVSSSQTVTDTAALFGGCNVSSAVFSTEATICDKVDVSTFVCELPILAG